MLKLISILVLTSLLQSCEGSDLKGAATIAAAKPRAATAETKPPANPSSDDGSVANPNGSGTPQGSGTNTGAIQGSDGSMSGAGGGTTIVNPVPAVQPTILAGATLTCIPNSLNTLLKCETRSKDKNVLTDFPMRGLYIILTEAALWTEMKYSRIAPGTYEATLPASPPPTYMVSMGLNDNSYSFSKVGTGELPYGNLVAEGSFETVAPSAGTFSAADMNPTGWKVTPSSVGSCGLIDPSFLLNSNKSAATGESTLYGSFWTELRTPCPGSSTYGNIRLTQNLKTKARHFYEYNFKYKVIGEGASGVNIFNDGIQFATHILANVAWTSSAPVLFSAVKDGLDFGIEENQAVIVRGTQLDDVRFIDLGTPPK